MSFSDSARVKARPDVLSRVLDGEAVILDLESGTYYGLNPTGSDVWNLIAEGATVKQLCDKIVELYEVDAARAREDMVQLLGELEQRGLVDIR